MQDEALRAALPAFQGLLPRGSRRRPPGRPPAPGPRPPRAGSWRPPRGSRPPPCGRRLAPHGRSGPPHRGRRWRKLKEWRPFRRVSGAWRGRLRSYGLAATRGRPCRGCCSSPTRRAPPTRRPSLAPCRGDQPSCSARSERPTPCRRGARLRRIAEERGLRLLVGADERLARALRADGVHPARPAGAPGAAPEGGASGLDRHRGGALDPGGAAGAGRRRGCGGGFGHLPERQPLGGQGDRPRCGWPGWCGPHRGRSMRWAGSTTRRPAF